MKNLCCGQKALIVGGILGAIYLWKKKKAAVGAYRWKPNAAQRQAYAERMQEKESMPIVRSKGAIREGCRLEWYSPSDGTTYSGIVRKHSYGEKTGQHTFTIDLDTGGYKLVKGRNLYTNLLKHIPGEISIRESK